MSWKDKVKSLTETIKKYQKATGRDREELSQTIMDTVRFWYLINQDISYVSSHAALVKFSDTQSFWLPKKYIEVYEHYWRVTLPLDGFVVKNLDGKIIHFLPLWKRFGNPKRATDEEMQEFDVYHHEPPYLKPLEGVKADDRLKR